ncbi:MAG: hypothetical protein OXL97_06635 [Chloroflexota bacterium]|nr:hypothetical protein [Chloroflexota bacterium]MDE2884398.1 hypothetical protein [Chloroflexota bacterium]
MNEQQLVRTLNSVGKRCFVTWFRQFCDLSLSNEDVAAQMEEAERYSARTCRTRTSGARSIIRAGRGRDALEKITRSKADAWTRQEASKLLTSRG